MEQLLKMTWSWLAFWTFISIDRWRRGHDGAVSSSLLGEADILIRGFLIWGIVEEEETMKKLVSSSMVSKPTNVYLAT